MPILMSGVGCSIIGETRGASSVYGRDEDATRSGVLEGCIESRDIDSPISSPNRVVIEGGTLAGTGPGRAGRSEMSLNISRGQLCLHLGVRRGVKK